MSDYKPVVFEIASQEYGIDINSVKGIEQVLTIVPVPNSNPYIKGIVNLRGEVIPVFSLRRKFNLDDGKYTNDTKFVVVKLRNFSLALEVDKVQDIKEIDKSMIHQIPFMVKNDETTYFREILNVHGRLVIIIDIDNILTDDEEERLLEMVSDLD